MSNSALEIFVVDVVPSLSTQELAFEVETFLAIKDERDLTFNERSALNAIFTHDPFVSEVLAS